MVVKVVETDTFGGQPNYCWVNRIEFSMPDGSTTRAIVRRVKRELGWRGRSTTQDEGDSLILHPRGHHVVAFVYCEAEPPVAYDYMTDLMAFEEGSLDEAGVLRLFSYLIGNGWAWKLQGFYGRTAMDLIDNGIIGSDGTILKEGM